MRKTKIRALLYLAAFVFVFVFSYGASALTYIPEHLIPTGTSSANVRLLQEALFELDFYNGDITGIYDANTVSSVKALQQSASLYDSGIFSKQTAAALNEIIAARLVREEADKNPLKGYTIGIDAGHQKTADLEYEPIAPGSNNTKARMSEGCAGVKSGTPEYELTLLVSKKLQKLLEDAGASVVMARTKHDVSLSNAERAKLMNEKGVDFWLRIHCDSSADKEKTGAHAIVPSKVNAPDIAQESLELSKHVLLQFSKKTGAKRNAILVREDQTGMNWSKSPVVTIEMGYLSNPLEDMALNRNSYQDLCARGIYNGVTAYIERLRESKAKAGE